MSWKTVTASIVALSAVGLLRTAPASADSLNIGISIGTPPPPPPPVMVTAPPQIVVVPGSSVYYAPGVDVNLFVYGGRYYTFHNGAWFFATSHRGPWTFVAKDRVPGPVLAVPVGYYKIPPGQAKKMGGPEFAGHGKGPKGKRGRDD